MKQEIEQSISEGLPSGITLTERGLIFPSTPLSYEQWSDLGRRLGRFHIASTLAIGDWINYGESSFGQKYKKALKTTGLEYQALADIAYTARRIAVSRRRENLSISHHREVAKLDPEDQEKWLKTAEEEKLTRRVLRASIKIGRVFDPEKDKDPKEQIASNQADNYHVHLIGLRSQFAKMREKYGEFHKWPEKKRMVLQRDTEDLFETLKQIHAN